MIAWPFLSSVTAAFLPVLNTALILSTLLTTGLLLGSVLLSSRLNLGSAMHDVRVWLGQSFSRHSPLSVALWLGLLLALLVPVITYRFIPGLDTYKYLNVVNYMVDVGQYPTSMAVEFSSANWSYPPLMQYLSHGLSYLGVAPYVFFKYFGVLIFSLALFPFLQLVKRFVEKRTVVVLAIIAFFATPAIFSELQVVRPQLVMFFLAPLSLVLMIDYLETKSKIPLFVVAASALIGTVYHTFLTVVLFIPLGVGVLVKNYGWIKSNKPKFLLGLAVTALALVPYYFLLDLPAKFGWLFKIIFTRSGELTLHSPYSLKTYLATIGIFTVGLCWLALVGLKDRAHLKKAIIPASFFALFFFVLEIWTRLGFSFLPDRSFPFIVIALIPLIAHGVDLLWKDRRIQAVVTVALLLLLASTAYIESLDTRQYVTSKEAEAAQFIKENFPQNTLIVTQGSNYPLTNYFAARRGSFKVSFSPRDVFYAENSASAFKVIESYIVSTKTYRQQLVERIAPHQAQILELLKSKSFRDSTVFSKISGINNKTENIYLALAKRSFREPEPEEVLILFSTDKLARSINTDRYKYKNFHDADLSLFDDARFFKKIFDNGAVKVWRVKI